MPVVATYLTQEEMRKLERKAERKKMSKYEYAQKLIKAALEDEDVEQGGGVQETDSGTGKDSGSTSQEPDWKRKYEEYRRKYGGT